MPPREGIYGLLAEFDTPASWCAAAAAAPTATAGAAWSATRPIRCEEAAEAIGFHKQPRAAGHA